MVEKTKEIQVVATAAQSTLDVDLTKLPKTLEKMAKNYDSFSHSMLLCFTAAEASNEKFTKLRNSVVVDALEYQKYVVPSVQKVLNATSQIFLNFIDGYRNFRDFLDDMRGFKQDASDISRALTYIRTLHSPVVEQATIRSTEANNVLAALTAESDEYKKQIKVKEEEIAKLRTNAETCRNPWFFLLHAIPIAGGIAHFTILKVGNHKLSKVTDKSHDVNINTTKCQVNTNAALVIQECLVPALQKYLSVMEALQQIFRQIEMEAANISETANKIEQEGRALVMFNKMQAAAQRVTNSSMSLLAFYDTAHSRLNALQQLSITNNPSWVAMWDAAYKENKKNQKSMFNRLKAIVVPDLKSVKIVAIKDE